MSKQGIELFLLCVHMFNKFVKSEGNSLQNDTESGIYTGRSMQRSDMITVLPASLTHTACALHFGYGQAGNIHW